MGRRKGGVRIDTKENREQKGRELRTVRTDTEENERGIEEREQKQIGVRERLDCENR